MANKLTSMSNVRQIIKLFSQQMGMKKIGELFVTLPFFGLL
jgi:hypothetical protein